VIVGFVDIGGIVDHHCLSFLFIEIYLFKHLRLIDSENLTLSTIHSTQTTEKKKQIHSS
jgi:hypothetical protein